MDIFGLTPIDTALASWGLNFSQDLIEFLFIRSHFGVLAFVMGFLWSIWESSKEANFKHFFIFIFLSLAILLLFILPNRPESAIKSAQEIYGTAPSLTAQALKSAQTSHSQIPIMLSFVGQMADLAGMAAIYRVDESLQENLRFLSRPFGLQRLSLQSYQVINSPITDEGLREDIDKFMYAYYLPALIMLRNDQHVNNPSFFWPGNEQIVNYYSSMGRQQWLDLKSRLKHLIDDPQGVWVETREILNQIKPQENLDDQMMASIIHGQYHIKENTWLKWAGRIQTSFPYILGWGNFCLYASFPFVLVALMVIRRFTLFAQYVEIFIWIKSWMVGCAISFYISLFAARVQAQTSMDAAWFWNYPYYVALSSVLLMIMPILTFIGIHKSFQSITNRY
jgi:hypothetical protein